MDNWRGKSMLELDSLISNEYVRFLIVIIGTIIVIAFSYFILKFIVNKVTGKEKSYGQFIIKKISKPVFYLIFFIGLYTASKNLSISNVYYFTINNNNYYLVDSIFFIILTFVLALFISRILSISMLGWVKVKKGFQRTPGLINKIITFIIFIVAIFVILAYFKIDITPMVAGVGLGALAIGLALQSTLSNFFAGVHLLSDRPINVGDFIELDKDTSGIVEDIGWRSTRIRMLTDNLLIIPNGKLAESNIINYSMPKQDMDIWIPCGVAYESNLKKVEKVTLEVAKEIQKTAPGAIKDFEPLLRYREFGESNINFITILRIEKPMARFIVRTEFIKALKERYDKENIEISWPIRKIYNMK